MLATISTANLTGLEGYRVEVEVDTSFGLPNFTIVGLGATAIQESRERVRSAIKNSGFGFPTHRITVNLAPAHVRKDGAQFDLPIAVGILVANDCLRPPRPDQLFIGELSLDGRTRSVTGLLALALSAKELGFTEIFTPRHNEAELSIINGQGVKIYPVDSLTSLVDHLEAKKLISPIQPRTIAATPKLPILPNLSSVKGQVQAKRALEIAATGGHNVLLQGPPGSGKTLLAQCLPGILPAPSTDEIVAITKLYSVASLLTSHGSAMTSRPFRAPHHTASISAVIGGGSTAKPGEVTLAHHGVLFLDELPEFDRHVLEALRQPLEERQLTIARARTTVCYPADFIFVGAANPCPCGYWGSNQKECFCSVGQVTAYRKRLSGPLLDRIDLHVAVQPVKSTELMSDKLAEDSRVVQQRVERAMLTLQNQHDPYAIDTKAKKVLEEAVKRFGLSARSYYRLLKVAQTIAALERSDMIKSDHIAEACQYRPAAESIA